MAAPDWTATAIASATGIISAIATSIFKMGALTNAMNELRSDVRELKDRLDKQSDKVIYKDVCAARQENIENQFRAITDRLDRRDTEDTGRWQALDTRLDRLEGLIRQNGNGRRA